MRWAAHVSYAMEQENYFALLKRIKYARRLCIQEGHPVTDEEIAKRVGITIKKLQKLLVTFRDPVSIHERYLQDVTFQVSKVHKLCSYSCPMLCRYKDIHLYICSMYSHSLYSFTRSSYKLNMFATSSPKDSSCSNLSHNLEANSSIHSE